MRHKWVFILSVLCKSGWLFPSSHGPCKCAAALISQLRISDKGHGHEAPSFHLALYIEHPSQETCTPSPASTSSS